MRESKVDNAVKIFTFESEDDLYFQLDKYLMGDAVTDGKCMRLKNLQLVDKTHALAYLEEDTSVIAVVFSHNGEELRCEECPFDRLLLPYAEVQLMNELGQVTIEDTTYDIENIEYCVNSMGGRYVDIILG